MQTQADQQASGGKLWMGFSDARPRLESCPLPKLPTPEGPRARWLLLLLRSLAKMIAVGHWTSHTLLIPKCFLSCPNLPADYGLIPHCLPDSVLTWPTGILSSMYHLELSS